MTIKIYVENLEMHVFQKARRRAACHGWILDKHDRIGYIDVLIFYSDELSNIAHVIPILERAHSLVIISVIDYWFYPDRTDSQLRAV